MKSAIQSVLYDKKYYSFEDALNSVIENHFKHNKVDIKKNKYRFRQLDPNIFKYMWIKKIKNGLELVIGFF